MPSLLHQFTSLRRAPTKYGLAPHKPILLLAVIDGFEKGYLWGKEVSISEELLTSFRRLPRAGSSPIDRSFPGGRHPKI